MLSESLIRLLWRLGTQVDAVATNSDLCAVRAVLVWIDFTYNHGIAFFVSHVQLDVVVVYAKEHVGTG